MIRRPGGLPTYAMWGVIAVVDLALLAAAAGPLLVLLIAVTLALTTGAVLAVRPPKPQRRRA